MRHFISKLAIPILVGCASAAMAGPDMPEPAKFTAVVAASTNTVTGPTTVNGWVDAIVLDWTVGGGTVTQTGTVSIATVGSTGSGPAKTILTLTAIAASDGIYFPRATAVGTTGSAIATITGERIPLVNDKIIVTLKDTTATNTTALTVYVYTSPVSP